MVLTMLADRGVGGLDDGGAFDLIELVAKLGGTLEFQVSRRFEHLSSQQFLPRSVATKIRRLLMLRRLLRFARNDAVTPADTARRSTACSGRAPAAPTRRRRPG